MAASAKVLALLVFMVVAILWMAEAEGMVGSTERNERSLRGTHTNLRGYQCPGKCQYRCSQTQYKKPCLFFCNKCCRKCLCVPPGFYGNKQICPCYNNWKTKRGGPKCP
ncbi:unnamed protein product [Victoria cruziana]